MFENMTNCMIFLPSDPAEISQLDHQVVDAGTNASIVCKVDANPITADMITWTRTGYDLAAQTVITYVDGTSTLTVLDAGKADSGVFMCKANNGIGDAVEKTVDFIVKCEWELIIIFKKIKLLY